jgi:hypothetical protein
MERKGVSWRAFLIGFLLIPPNVYWVMMVEGIWHTGHPSVMALPWNVVFTTLVLLVINLLIKRTFPSLALTQGEFIVIYIMLALASVIAGHDSLQLGIPEMAIPHWLATPENKWQQLFFKYLPKWLIVPKKDMVAPFFIGGENFFKKEYLRAWLPPILWWCLFIFFLGLMMIAINSIIRKQWVENEKLSYPIIQLPLAMTERGGEATFFKNKILWAGFGVAALIDIINGLHVLYPTFPLYIRVRHDEVDLGQYITTPPWNAIGWLPLPLYPFIIAMGYFMPIDLSFSLWFFYLFKKMLLVITAAFGYQERTGAFPYINEQSYGAWFALFFYAVWGARRHLWLTIKKVFGKADIDDSNEPLSYRSAYLLLLVSFSFLVWFCVRAGMSLGITLAFFFIVFVILFAITRVRAEVGPPTHEMAGSMNAYNILTEFLGTKGVGGNNLTVFCLFWWLTGRGYRTTPMPFYLEGYKMAEEAKTSARGLIYAMAFALPWGAFCAYIAACYEQFKVGPSPLLDHNYYIYNQLATDLSSPRAVNPGAMIAMGVGVAFTVLMMNMRARFVWWPLHPVGYAISMNFGAEYYWSCLVISTLIKFIVIKVGGYKWHRRVIPFMFGIILGEYSVGAFWSVMSVILRQRMYDFCPG